ncbi:MAG: prenyltransferase/squalene oxidase repeat-containing protein [Streptosporangiaceae bacterium]
MVTPENLIDGHFYESFPGYADFGLTIDGALALAATGDEDPALKGIVTFLDEAGKDPHGYTINTWTGIGTREVSGGSLGAEAVLAEATGYSPRHFGGHNVIDALNASVCARASSGGNTSCAGAGNYTYSFSTFDQAVGIIAQIRAGQISEAASPIRFLEGLRNSNGSFPSLIPDSHDQDVDSTAMAMMVLALTPGASASADVKSGVAWIASRQESNGGFPGTSGDSVNSAGLAIQALTLLRSQYQRQIDAALGFLAHEQNSNGGFDVAAGQRGSNVRASTQALGGAAGTSFGTLERNLRSTSTPPPTPPPGHKGHPAPKKSPAPQPTVTVTQTGPATPSATRTPAAAAPASSSSPPAVLLPRTGHGLTMARTADDSSLTSDLWWSVAGVAIAAAVVIGLLFVRRRRLYPAAGRGA